MTARPGITWRRDDYARGCIVVYRRSLWRIAAVWSAAVAVFWLAACGLCR
jgi:hypothetical protein